MKGNCKILPQKIYAPKRSIDGPVILTSVNKTLHFRTLVDRVLHGLALDFDRKGFLQKMTVYENGKEAPKGKYFSLDHYSVDNHFKATSLWISEGEKCLVLIGKGAGFYCGTVDTR